MKKQSNNFILITYITKRSIFLTIIPLLLVCLFLGWLYRAADFESNLFLPGEGSTTIQIIEAVLLVVLTFISGILVVLALRYNRRKFLKIFFSVGLFLISLSVLWLHGYFLEVQYFEDFFWIEIIGGIIGVFIGIATILVLILERGNQLTKNILIITLGIAVGSVFGLILSLITFLVLICLISVFDIYSVFKGPINKMLEETNMISFDSITSSAQKAMAIGIGDFIFYSALVTFVSREFSIVFGIISIIGVIVGIKITEKMLEKHNRFPGLPIPIFLALLLVGIGWLINTFILSPINWGF